MKDFIKSLYYSLTRSERNHLIVGLAFNDKTLITGRETAPDNLMMNERFLCRASNLLGYGFFKSDDHSVGAVSERISQVSRDIDKSCGRDGACYELLAWFESGDGSSRRWEIVECFRVIDKRRKSLKRLKKLRKANHERMEARG